jgi:predicted metalloprotease with PDZ domain
VNRIRLVAVSFIAAAALSTSAGAQQQSIDYEISFPNAAQHEGAVVATIRGIPRGQPLEARMARSSPGRYSPTGFAKNIYDVRAADGSGRTLAVTKPHPHGWDIAGHDGTVKLTYKVWGDRTDGTYLSIDHSHAHMNIPATFMFVPKMSSAPIRLKIHSRPGWRVATQLVPTADSTVFTAPNMQYFMDSPTEAGPVMFSNFQIADRSRASNIRLAVHHLGTQAHVDSLAMLTQKIVAEQIAVFGEGPGFDYGTFTFVIDYLPWASGDGMEHRNSTVVSSTRSIATEQGRKGALGTIAHEFFHVWNMERLRARAIEPFDFERDNMSQELWFGEGFTNYYDQLTIRRAGLFTDEEFLQNMGSEVLGVVSSPGRRHGSPVTNSMDAPFFDGAAWRDPTRAANTFVSYYTWGSTVGIGLDLILRTRFNTTLDDYMRLLWRDYGRHQTPALTPARPYTMADLRSALGSLTRDTAFANDFFRRYVENGDVPDYAPLFARAGFLMKAEDASIPVLGASLADDTTAVFVNWSSENGSAFAAGVSSGDRIFAIDGVPVNTADSVNAIIRRKRVGETVQLDIVQRTVRRTIPMRLVSVPRYSVSTYEKAGMPVTDAMKRFREEWLGSKARR